MSTKYVITFSNCTENGVETFCGKQTVLEYVTEIIADCAKNVGIALDNCTAYPVSGMYKGVSETSFRLEYIVSAPIEHEIKGLALWIKDVYKQESILLETYSNDGYKAELILGLGSCEEL